MHFTYCPPDHPLRAKRRGPHHVWTDVNVPSVKAWRIRLYYRTLRRAGLGAPEARAIIWDLVAITPRLSDHDMRYP